MEPNTSSSTMTSSLLKRSNWLFPAALLFTLSLQACGGGSSSDPVSDTSPDTDTPADTTDSVDEPSSEAPVDESSDDEAMIIVTTPATENDLIPGGGMLYNGYDNVAVLQREAFGQVSPGPEVLRTEISHTGADDNPYLRIDGLYSVTLDGEDAGVDSGIDLVGIMTNISDSVQCQIFMTLESATLSDGSTLESRVSTFFEINGAVGDNILDQAPSDCILPATSAYFYLSDPRLKDEAGTTYIPSNGEVQSVELSSLSSRTPSSLQFEVGAVSAMLSGSALTLQNTGDFGYDVVGSTIYALDGEGLPIAVSEVIGRQSSVELAPGESTTLSTPNYGNFGQAVAQYVVVVAYDDL